jgi:hypothetical protein
MGVSATVAFVSPGRDGLVPVTESLLDEAQPAAAAFLARYSGADVRGLPI